MKRIEDIDDHLVAHDAATLAVSGALGVVAAAVRMLVVATPTAGSPVTAAGIGGMKVGAVRRTVNRAVLAVDEAAKGKGK